MGAIKRLNNYESGVVSPLYICFKVKDESFSGEYFEKWVTVPGRYQLLVHPEQWS